MQAAPEVPKRVTFPKKLGKPERLNEDGRQSGEASVITNWHTHVKIFLFTTGDDTGDECEIVGWLSFPHPLRPQVFNINNQHEALFANFSAENGGLGKLYADQAFDNSDALPNGFQAFLGEEDSGTDWILAFVMDWTNPANSEYRDGREWVWTSTSGDDSRYVAKMWVQVTTF